MKDYTSGNPVFSEKIRIVEPSDPAHADNVNAAPVQLLQNTLANRNAIKALQAGMNAICSILYGYSHDGGSKKITSFLPHNHADGKLEFPEGAAYRDGDKIVLTGGSAMGMPQFPGTGTDDGATAGSVQEIAVAAARMVQENMEEISADQARGLFGFADNK